MSDQQRQENWGLYVVQHTGKPCSVTCDMSWNDYDIDLAKPYALQLMFTLTTDNGSGLPQRAELDQVQEHQEAIETELASAVGAVPVGTRTGLGKKIVLLYAQQDVKDQRFLAGLASRYPQPRLTLSSTHDPDWTTYFKNFYPNEQQRRWMDDASVCFAIRQSGDACTQPRSIEHLAYFSTPDARDRFEAWCTSHRFTIDDRNDDAESEYPYALYFSHQGVPEPDEIAQYTWPAHQAAQQLGGVYDGWETIVVSDHTAPRGLLQRLLQLFKLRRG